MDADGSNQIQITQKNGGFPLAVSSDGNTIFYHHGRDRTLWQVSNTGGNEQIVFNQKKYDFAVSPDGSQIAFSDTKGEERFLSVYSIADKTIVKNFPIPISKSRILEIEWLPDKKGIVYVLTNVASGAYSLWMQKFNKEKSSQIIDFKDESFPESSGLAISPDSKYFTITQGGWRHDAILLKGLK
jgi:Tol biopolymer transport system component